jgi:O-antigen/teichoic acid export membrane protein
VSESNNPTPTGRRLFGGTALLLAMRAAGLVMGFAVSLMLARGLGARALGTFATGLALVQIGSMLTDFGLGALLIREGSAAPDLRAAMFRWATRTRVASGIAVFVALTATSLILVEGTAARLSVVLVVSTVPLTALTLGMTVLEQGLHLTRMALLTLAQSVAWLVIVATLFTAHAGLRGYAIAFMAYNAGYGILVHYVARRSLAGPAEPMSGRHFSRLMRGVLPLSVTMILVTLYYKLDSLFVYRFAGAEAAANYAIAYRFLDQLSIVPLTLGNIFLPLLTRRHSSGESTHTLFRQYVRVALVFSTPIVGIGLIIARPLVSLFGDGYGDAVLLLRLLLPTFAVISFAYVVVHVSIAHRQSGKQLRAVCVGLAINVALNLVFVPRYGARAAAIVTGLTELGVVAILYFLLRRPCGLTLPLAWLARLVAVLAVSGGAAVLLRTNPYLASVAFTVVYAVGVALLSVVDVAEIRALLKRPGPVPVPRVSGETGQQLLDPVPERLGAEH